MHGDSIISEHTTNFTPLFIQWRGRLHAVHTDEIEELIYQLERPHPTRDTHLNHGCRPRQHAGVVPTFSPHRCLFSLPRHSILDLPDRRRRLERLVSMTVNTAQPRAPSSTFAQAKNGEGVVRDEKRDTTLASRKVVLRYK